MQEGQEGRTENMNLDLPGARCTEFLLETEFECTEEIRRRVDALLEAADTSTPRRQGDDRTIRYGDKYDHAKEQVGVGGRLEEIIADGTERILVQCRYFQPTENLPDPPEDFRPISNLFEVMPDLAGSVSIDCEATFNYLYQDGYRSRITLPVPLLLADLNSPTGLTHIESVSLSQREAGQQTHVVVVYTIVDEDGNDSGIAHGVEFSSTTTFTINNVRQIFEVAKRLSSSLIFTQE